MFEGRVIALMRGPVAVAKLTTEMVRQGWSAKRIVGFYLSRLTAYGVKVPK